MTRQEIFSNLVPGRETLGTSLCTLWKIENRTEKQSFWVRFKERSKENDIFQISAAGEPLWKWLATPPQAQRKELNRWDKQYTSILPGLAVICPLAQICLVSNSCIAVQVQSYDTARNNHLVFTFCLYFVFVIADQLDLTTSRAAKAELEKRKMTAALKTWVRRAWGRGGAKDFEKV